MPNAGPPPLPPPTYVDAPLQPQHPPTAIPNYLAQAIVLTVVGLCCWFGPTLAGIPAIVFAAKVNTKLQIGDVAGAMRASRLAKIWCWVSFGLLLLAAVIMLFVFAIPVAWEA